MSANGLDNRLNIEEQFILRLPQELASKVGEMVRSGKLDDIQIKFAHGRNQRQGTLIMNSETYKLTLADLPTVVETHKTLDGKTFYKSADIGQVLLVGDKDKETGESLKVKLTLGKDDREKEDQPRGDRQMGEDYELFDGLTPPTHNIRKRRFRKIPKYRSSEVHNAEDEINRQMASGGSGTAARDDISYEPIPVEDVESILELPSGVTVVLLKHGPPFKTGTMGVRWTNDELSAIPAEHRARLQTQGGVAFDKDDDDDMDDDEFEKLPDLPPTLPSASSVPSAPGAAPLQNETEVRRLRIAKIELTKKYNTLATSIKKLSVTARNERNQTMKQRLEEQMRASMTEIEERQAEMSRLDAELAKHGAA